MLDQVSAIADFMIAAFLHIWPYLVITIPLAVAVRMSGAARYIKRAFQARPLIAIFLATAVGAFSPFCSCGVIPVIAALLMSGVPLAPVMSFWIASPSMDPEAFFLSVSTIGWQLAVWRLAGTLILSLSAGLITHFVVSRGWLGQDLLRQQQTPAVQSTRALLTKNWQKLKRVLTSSSMQPSVRRQPVLATEVTSRSSDLAAHLPSGLTTDPGVFTNLDVGSEPTRGTPTPIFTPASSCDTGCDTGQDDSCGSTVQSSCGANAPFFRQRLFIETANATLLVAKFMALAFFLEALITLYIPDEWIVGLLGHQNPWSIPTAAVFGVPMYTSNLAALPMVSGLLEQGMNPAAGLAFLIAGPTTTLPAMAAVWGITTRRVFGLYVSFSLVGAVVLGYLFGLVA